MDVSEDLKTWANRSDGLAVTMFYDVDVAQSDGNTFGGGAQDNGTVVTTNGAANKFQEVNGGDGGWMIVNPSDARQFYSSLYNMGIFRHREGAGKMEPARNKRRKMRYGWSFSTWTRTTPGLCTLGIARVAHPNGRRKLEGRLRRAR